jgi:hypothetical protein
MLKIESETILLFNDEEDTMLVSTFNKKWKRDLNKLAAERPEECIIISAGEDPEEELKVSMPKSWLKIKAPKIYTEEEREARRKRSQELAKHLRKNSNNEEDDEGDED